MSVPQGDDLAHHVVVLTGGIGAGKSTVLKYLEELGARVLSADALAREAVKPGSTALSLIAAEFGSAVLFPDGSLDRRALAGIVFADPGKLRKLESITHPAIRELADSELQKAVESGGLVVYECPLLYETDLWKRPWRAVVAVTAPEHDIRRRVAARDHLEDRAIESRLAAQLPQNERASRADFVLHNDGDLVKLKGLVEELYQRLGSKAG